MVGEGVLESGDWAQTMRVTRPRSRRSSAWRRVGGGKSTCSVVRRDLWALERVWSGLHGGLVWVVGAAAGRELRMEVRRARGVGRGGDAGCMTLWFVGG